jgi:hypothetical protein
MSTFVHEVHSVPLDSSTALYIPSSMKFIYFFIFNDTTALNGPGPSHY